MPPASVIGKQGVNRLECVICQKGPLVKRQVFSVSSGQQVVFSSGVERSGCGISQGTGATGDIYIA